MDIWSVIGATVAVVCVGLIKGRLQQQRQEKQATGEWPTKALLEFEARQVALQAERRQAFARMGYRLGSWMRRVLPT